MTSRARKLLDEVLALPQDEREELVSALTESLEPVRVSPEWEAELARRVEAVASGEARVLDAASHLAELRAKYR